MDPEQRDPEPVAAPLGRDRQCIHCGEWKRCLDSDGWCDTCAGRPAPQPSKAELIHGLELCLSRLEAAGKRDSARVVRGQIAALRGDTMVSLMSFPKYVPECGGYTDSLGQHHDCASKVKGVQFCVTCGTAQRAANKRKAIRADQQARRERRQGKTYGPPPEGEDVFRGFRGK